MFLFFFSFKASSSLSPTPLLTAGGATGKNASDLISPPKIGDTHISLYLQRRFPPSTSCLFNSSFPGLFHILRTKVSQKIFTASLCGCEDIKFDTYFSFGIAIHSVWGFRAVKGTKVSSCCFGTEGRADTAPANLFSVIAGSSLNVRSLIWTGGKRLAAKDDN